MCDSLLFGDFFENQILVANIIKKCVALQYVFLTYTCDMVVSLTIFLDVSYGLYRPVASFAVEITRFRLLIRMIFG